MAKTKTDNRPMVNEVNCETGEIIFREMTDEEFASYKVMQSEAETI